VTATIQGMISNLEEAFEIFDFAYACLGDPEIGVIWERGSCEGLDGADLPRTMFGDLEAISSTLLYLEANKPPRMMSQGETRSVMGNLECENKKYPYSFFLNTDTSVIEHHEFAKKVYGWLNSQINQNQ
jgi:hypothetical protein